MVNDYVEGSCASSLSRTELGKAGGRRVEPAVALLDQDLLAQRWSNAEIAIQLILSPKTVRNYVSLILSKLPVPDQAEARAAARTAVLGHKLLERGTSR